jgi:hypothetical protein
MLSFKNDSINVAEYVYDFATDAGAVASVTLSAKDQKSPLPAGAIVTNAYAWVQTACTSEGLATLAFGLGEDVDALIDETAVASLTANAVFTGDSTVVAGTSVARIANAAGGVVTATVGTAALTAGKVSLFIEFINPAGQ